MSDFIEIDAKRCTGCGLCAKDCIEKLIYFENGTAHVDKRCFMCGHCIAICPANAVKCVHPHFCPEDVADEITALDPEEFLKAVKSRRSIRNFKNKPVKHEDLEKVLEAGRWSETASNRRKAKYIVVDEHLEQFKTEVWEAWKRLGDEGKLGRYKENGFADKIYNEWKENPKNDALFFNAPCLIFITGFDPIDTGIEIANIEHMAASMGMGILITGFMKNVFNNSEELLAKLPIEEGTKLMECIFIGYPAVKYYRTTPHRPLKIEYL